MEFYLFRNPVVYCVKSTQTIEDTIKKSRFIGVIIPCCSEIEVIQNLRQLSCDYPDASHIAYGFKIKTENNWISRFHDAGEPGGTAGKPIFQHLEGKELVNVLIAVIRYFGGIKLGTGGLTRAYGNTAKKAINNAELIPYIEYDTVSFILDYTQIQSFEYHLKKMEGKILQRSFTDRVEMVVSLPKGNTTDFTRAVVK